MLALTQVQAVPLTARVAGDAHVLPVAAVVLAPWAPGTLEEAGLPSRAADIIQPDGPCAGFKMVGRGLPAIPVVTEHTVHSAVRTCFQESAQTPDLAPDFRGRHALLLLGASQLCLLHHTF